MARGALRIVADYCLKHGKRVSGLSVDDVAQILGRELRYLDQHRRYSYRKWIRRFFRSAWEERRISIDAATAARVVRPEQIDE
jgi:hypothetical protein